MHSTPQFGFRLVNETTAEKYVDMDSFTAVSRAWAEILESVSVDQLSVKDKRTFRWVVTNLGIGSAVLGMEPRELIEEKEVPPLPEDFWDDLSQHLADGLAQVEKGFAPEDVFSDVLVDPVYLLISTFDSNGVAAIEFDLPGHSIMLTREGAGQHQIRRIRERSIGSITGMLTSLSFSGRTPFFGLRPRGGRVIKCRFNADLQTQQVKAALQSNVSVFGRLVRDEDGTVVVVQEVWDIDVLPDDDSLMSVDQMYGAEPDLTDDLNSVEWVRMIRGQ